MSTPPTRIVPRVRPIQARDEVEQRALARARGPHEGQELRCGDGEGNVLQHRDDLAPAAVGFA